MVWSPSPASPSAIYNEGQTALTLVPVAEINGDFLDIHHRHHLRNVLALTVFLFVMGVGGYMVLEGWHFSESLYMVVITLATVGYGEVLPLSWVGRYFTMALIMSGAGTLAYAISVLTSYLISGKLKNDILHRHMQERIRKLEEQVVICGFGMFGRQVAAILKREKIPCVILERNEDLLDDLVAAKQPFLLGDATEAEVLQKANIAKARAVIIATNDDTENVFLTLAVRHQNATVPIVARASHDRLQNKLRQAGADRIVVPHRLGAYNMATMATMPALIDFFNLITDETREDMCAEEVRLRAGDAACDKTLADFLNKIGGVSVLAVLRPDGSNVVNPERKLKLHEGDALITFGRKKDLRTLARVMIGGRSRWRK